jgi:phage terminase Nu1 subunit (DNA packaging protein)
MPEKTLKGWNCTIGELAEICGLTVKAIRDAVSAGCPVIKAGKTGKGNATVINVHDYLEWRSARRPNKDIGGNGTKERLDAIRIQRAELELAKATGDLIHFRELAPFVQDKLMGFRQALYQIPPEMRQQYGSEAGAFCEKRIRETLNHLAGGAGIGGIEEHARDIAKSR